MLFFEPLDALPSLGKFVSDGDRRHHGRPGVADLAEFGAQVVDAIVELARTIHQMAFLAVFAGHSKLPAIDRYADLRHSLAMFPLCYSMGETPYFRGRSSPAHPLRIYLANS